MATNFQLISLQHQSFANLFNLDDAALEKIDAIKMVVDEFPGFPCRVSLQDAAIGETVILLNHEHHNINTPYKANGPIFVRKTAVTAALKVNEIPLMFNHRLLSLRGFNSQGIMKDAIVVEGQNLKEKINEIFESEAISYIHIHNAKPGCYNCLVERA